MDHLALIEVILPEVPTEENRHLERRLTTNQLSFSTVTQILLLEIPTGKLDSLLQLNISYLKVTLKVNYILPHGVLETQTKLLFNNIQKNISPI